MSELLRLSIDLEATTEVPLARELEILSAYRLVRGAIDGDVTFMDNSWHYNAGEDALDDWRETH